MTDLIDESLPALLLQCVLQAIAKRSQSPWCVCLLIPVDYCLLPGGVRPFQIITQQSPAVDVFMAIDTKVLPVAPVRRIVLVITVFVVNRQEMAIYSIEFPAATTANQAVQGKRPFPIV